MRLWRHAAASGHHSWSTLAGTDVACGPRRPRRADRAGPPGRMGPAAGAEPHRWRTGTGAPDGRPVPVAPSPDGDRGDRSDRRPTWSRRPDRGMVAGGAVAAIHHVG